VSMRPACRKMCPAREDRPPAAPHMEARPSVALTGPSLEPACCVERWIDGKIWPDRELRPAQGPPIPLQPPEGDRNRKTINCAYNLQHAKGAESVLEQLTRSRGCVAGAQCKLTPAAGARASAPSQMAARHPHENRRRG
jgi:hypothetical protein